MVDIDTFLTILYVMVDDFCKAALPPERRPGPAAALSRSEVITLVLMAQWQRFESERAFYRYARRHWRDAFPSLPQRTQFNRLERRHAHALMACFGVCPTYPGEKMRNSLSYIEKKRLIHSSYNGFAI